MVSRNGAPVERGGGGRSQRAARVPEILVLVLFSACGYADGDPILTAWGSSGTAPDSSTQGASATGPLPTTAATILDGSGTGSASGSGSGSTGSETAAPEICACDPIAADQRCLRFVNACDETIWAGASGDEVPEGAFDGVGVLAPGECQAVAIDSVVGGRAWGATDCDDAGEACASNGASGQGTLVQFNLPVEGIDLYDVSLVDAFDLPMAMTPVGVILPPPPDQTCHPASCAADLNVVCPDALAHYDDQGAVAYCQSVCRACDACPGCDTCTMPLPAACDACSAVAEVCCTGRACGDNEHTMLWKSLCPDAITYAGEGPTFACDRHSDFDITFCP